MAEYLQLQLIIGNLWIFKHEDLSFDIKEGLNLSDGKMLT